MKFTLQLTFVSIFLVMLGSTTWASLEKNVFEAFADLGSDRWGLATLFDTYFGFFAFWLWTASKTQNNGVRAAWFISIMTLGNFAIAIYMLILLHKWDGKSLRGLYAPTPR